MALPAAHPCFGPDNVEMVGLGIALGWRNSPASSCYEEPTKDTPRSDTRTLQEGRLPRRQGLLWVGLPAGPLVRPQPCWSHRRGGHPPPHGLGKRLPEDSPSGPYMPGSVFSEGPVAGPLSWTRAGVRSARGTGVRGPRELPASGGRAARPGAAAPKQENVGAASVLFSLLV